MFVPQLEGVFKDETSYVIETNNKFYLCNAEGIRETIHVLLVEPGRAPRDVLIVSSLKSMQSIVGGYIEVVYPYEEPVALICNEEGKLLGLPLNRVLGGYDIIAGTFFLCGLREDDFGSLSDALLSKFKEEYKL